MDLDPCCSLLWGHFHLPLSKPDVQGGGTTLAVKMDASHISSASEFPKQPLTVPIFFLFVFEKFLLFKLTAPNKHMASHTAQLSNQIGD